MNTHGKRALLVAAGSIGLIILIWYLQLYKYLTLASLQDHRTLLEQTVIGNYWQAVLFFMAIYTAVIALAIPGLPPLTMLGGFLFGCLPAGIYATLSATIGTTISFLLIRYVLSNVIRGKYAQKLERFNERIHSHGAASYLLTLQLMGFIPYFVINTLAALTHVSTVTFMWTTCLGSVPIIFVYAFAGRQLYLVESVRDIFSPSIIALLLLLIGLSLVPILFKSFRKDKDLA
jgi:uncharacterized membrane protein YdjX (TVP38/TMEM64 family)